MKLSIYIPISERLDFLFIENQFLFKNNPPPQN